MKLVFRTADAQDLDGILMLYRELQPQDPRLPNTTAQQSLQHIIESPWLHLLVASVDDSPPLVASTYLNVLPNLTRNARPYAVIENVVTAEHLRGQGIGKALMRHTLAFAWEQGCYKAMLQTGSSNPNTHEFYRRCGFRADEKTGYLARPPASAN